MGVLFYVLENIGVNSFWCLLQQLDEYSDRASELLQKQTSMDSSSALRLINEALSISSYSESLHELKAQALLSVSENLFCIIKGVAV